jgi:hypothetical protein
MSLLWRQVELEEFDCDEPLALRVVAAKDGSESSSTNLMKHAKRAERIGRRTAGLFRVQRWTPREGRFTNRNIEHYSRTT